jgi:hypothetical protein
MRIHLFPRRGIAPLKPGKISTPVLITVQGKQVWENPHGKYTQIIIHTDGSGHQNGSCMPIQYLYLPFPSPLIVPSFHVSSVAADAFLFDPHCK